MADFRQQRQFKSREPQLRVDPGLPPGSYVFQLVVADQGGNQSRAAKVKVTIVEAREPIIPDGPGRLIRGGPGRPR